MAGLIPENVRVIVVDDDVSILRILKQLLKDKGYEVYTASNGKEAIDLIYDMDFDLVITDLMMPESDGLEVLRETKKRNPRTQVIMITGFATLDSAIEALKLGAFDYIRKPFKIAELDVTIRNAIDKIHLLKSNEILLNHLRETHKRLKETVSESVSVMERDIDALDVMDSDADTEDSRTEVLNRYGLVGESAALHLKRFEEGKETTALNELERLSKLYEKGVLTKEEFDICKKKLFEAL